MRSLLVTMVTVAFLFLVGCATTPSYSPSYSKFYSYKIYPSRASEEGNAYAEQVGGYQRGEAVLLVAWVGSRNSDAVATVEVKNAVSGDVVYENTSLFRSDKINFLNCGALPKGSYFALLYVEGTIMSRCSFNIH